MKKRIEHRYEKITGFLNYLPHYREAVERAKDGDLFIEIGCFLGKSTSFLATEIANSGKKIEFHAIDLFDFNMYSEPEKIWFNSSKEIKELEKNFADGEDISIRCTPFEIFKKNVEYVKKYVKYFKGDSRELVKNYKDNSVDFLFIDGDHTSEGFRKDIELWYPKIKNKGIMSGHDYNQKEIQENVDEFFKEEITEIDYQPWTIWQIIKDSNLEKQIEYETLSKIVVPKINLNLNWKKTKKNYFFTVNNSYELPNEIADYLFCNYKGKFEITPLEKRIIKRKSVICPKVELIPIVRDKNDNKLLWTVGIVNYKSIPFMEYQLKSLYEYNSILFF
jgi:hypothetical protein